MPTISETPWDEVVQEREFLAMGSSEREEFVDAYMADLTARIEAAGEMNVEMAAQLEIDRENILYDALDQPFLMLNPFTNFGRSFSKEWDATIQSWILKDTEAALEYRNSLDEEIVTYPGTSESLGRVTPSLLPIILVLILFILSIRQPILALKKRRRDARSARVGGSASEARHQPTYAVFNCSLCNSRIRIEAIIAPTKVACPACGSTYQCTRAESEGCVFVIYPEIAQGNNSTPNPLPAHVLRALKYFDLCPPVRFDQVRKVYRERVAQYHPDKVHGLGDEIKKVAEAKTREINENFSVVAQYYKH